MARERARASPRAGEARGHASAREDALRARDAALERAAALETLLEAGVRAPPVAAAAASETARDVADGAREAEGRAARERRADALEADLKTSSADSANRVAGLSRTHRRARGVWVAQRELVSARAAARAPPTRRRRARADGDA